MAGTGYFDYLQLCPIKTAVMTLSDLMKLPADKFRKIVKSAILATNKDQRAVLKRYEKATSELGIVLKQLNKKSKSALSFDKQLKDV